MGKVPVNRNKGSVAPIYVTPTAANVRESRTTRAVVLTAQQAALIDTRRDDAATVRAAKQAVAKKNKGKKTTKGGNGSGNTDGKVADAANTPQTTISSAVDITSGLSGDDSSTDSGVGPNTGLGLYGYRWNLPPHKWSLPVEPSENSLTVNSAAYTLGSLPAYRRGRIYFYSRVDSKLSTNTYNTGKNVGDNNHANDPRYGFQFLWNPETFQTSVTVNMDITPTWKDAFVSTVGAFPSGESLNVQFRIDRTNDFASIKSLPPGTTATGEDVYAAQATIAAKTYADYYEGGSGINGSGFDSFTSATGGQNLGEKILELQKYGTIADIEYLYKAINGPGWKNKATGKETSDIGFLMPTLLRIDIGPLSYLGYVNNMAINHVAFNKAMVPIRTDVSLQFNLMATAGLSSK